MDKLCGESNAFSVTEVFSKCTKLNSFIRRHLVSPDWTKCELNVLESHINESRTVAIEVIGSYQAFCMKVSKWHFILHLATGARQMGSVDALDADVLDSSHKKIKWQRKNTRKM